MPMFLVESELITSALILVGTFLSCVLAKLIMDGFIRRSSKRSQLEIDDVTLNTLKKPILLILSLSGLYLALSYIPTIPDYTISKYFLVLSNIAGAYAILKLLNLFFQRWKRTFSTEIARIRGVEAKFDLFQKIANVLIGILTFILILDQLGYHITPIITSLGIAGLAVALALQDTLANLFAGIYLTLDRPIGIGDLVKLDAGGEGFIENIGWRRTTIRLLDNSFLVIPNSRLSQSILTNYSLPDGELSVYVPCSVSYNKDFKDFKDLNYLDYLEEITLEVAAEVMQRVPGASKAWKPVLRYKDFAGSKVNFVVEMKVEEITNRDLLSHELIKSLFRRYKQEEIDVISA